MTLFANFIKQLFGARNPDDLARERINTWEAWLSPLPAPDGTGVGRDPVYDDAFIAVCDEIGKLSDINDALIVQLCEQLLREVGKDLRVAGYYVFARVRQNGAAGLTDGLELIAALVDRFGHALLPARDEAKRGAVELVAKTRVLEQLDRHGEFAPVELERATAALNLLLGKTSAWPEAARPDLQPLVSRFQENGDETVRPVPDGPAVPASGPRSSSGSTVASTRDALEHTRMLAQFLRNEEHGYLPAARLVRCVRWDTVHDVPPADAQGRTRLAPPRADLRQQLKRLVLQKQWPELLERVEGAYMEGVNHLWLDPHYFQHVALDHAGAPFTGWRASCGPTSRFSSIACTGSSGSCSTTARRSQTMRRLNGSQATRLCAISNRAKRSPRCPCRQTMKTVRLATGRKWKRRHPISRRGKASRPPSPGSTDCPASVRTVNAICSAGSWRA
jgi:type VI secretion system protein VasJ